MGVVKAARTLGVGVSTVQRVKSEMAAAAAQSAGAAHPSP